MVQSDFLYSIDAARAQTVLDGEFGRIELFDARLTPAQCAHWLEDLLEQMPWETERRKMYDRMVDVPRLFARVRLAAPDAHPVVKEAASHVRDVTGCDFDSVGLNFYRNEHDSVAWHNDKLHSLCPGAPIAILSLGETRPLSIRTKRVPRKSLEIDLTAGSILLMSYDTQLHLDHAILKQHGKCGVRVSLAFRKRISASHGSAEFG